VASPPTVWRMLDEMTPAASKRVEKARARIRRHVWGLLPAVPPSRVAGVGLGKVIVLDTDATLVTRCSNSDSWAPGCGCSRRTMTRIPAGQRDRSNKYFP
jgi:hypothetical protein